MPGTARRATRVVAAVVVVLLALGTGLLQSCAATGTQEDRPGASASDGATDPVSGLPYVAAADLPPEARETLGLIDDGGPFPYPDHDGATFHNFEGILPEEPDGYYREYTVDTPGLDHRGARRIVTGSGGELYWTDDHYESFAVIDR